MKREYVVALVTDLEGVVKADKDSKSRVGRVVLIDDSEIKEGKPFFVECIKPGYLKSFITSCVGDLTHADDGLVIKTENSVYYFVNKEDFERDKNVTFK